ncbi:MAG: hypothetical protein ACI8PZ_004726 [Myxococcota bacterium]
MFRTTLATLIVLTPSIASAACDWAPGPSAPLDYVRCIAEHIADFTPGDVGALMDGMTVLDARTTSACADGEALQGFDPDGGLICVPLPQVPRHVEGTTAGQIDFGFTHFLFEGRTDSMDGMAPPLELDTRSETVAVHFSGHVWLRSNDPVALPFSGSHIAIRPVIDGVPAATLCAYTGVEELADFVLEDSTLMPIVCDAVVTVEPGVHTFGLEATGRSIWAILYGGDAISLLTGFPAELGGRWYVEEVL